MVGTLPKKLLELIESIGGADAVRMVCERAEIPQDRAFRLSEVRDSEEWDRLLDASRDFIGLSEAEELINESLDQMTPEKKDEQTRKLRLLIHFTLETARRSVNRAEEKSEKLARSNRDLEHFAHLASHDLQSPLRRITSFSQLLKQRYHGEAGSQRRRDINHIIKSGEMGELVSDLLDTRKSIGPTNLPSP